MAGRTPSTEPMTLTDLAPPRVRDSWSALPADQQPPWPDPAAVQRVQAALSAAPALVDVPACDALREQLAAVARGEAFLLQGGDCAEVLDPQAPRRAVSTARLLRRMANVLEDAWTLPVVTVGRLAGQYAKPRSSAVEQRGAQVLPVYRGDAVNGAAFTAAARVADPRRLMEVYRASAATLAAVRRAGVGPVFASHEALLLPYESGLTRFDGVGGVPYDLSGHMVWVGERTRRLDGAHVEFAARIGNPVAVKLGPSVGADEAVALVERLDPQRLPGRVTLIARMGAGRVRDRLPELVERVRASGAGVVWVCDPMHGNTVQGAGGRKTRWVDRIREEVCGFFEVHRALGTHAGGVHLELTGAEVTECVGGRERPVAEGALGVRYESACDPRLNARQAVELVQDIAGLAGSWLPSALPGAG